MARGCFVAIVITVLGSAPCTALAADVTNFPLGISLEAGVSSVALANERFSASGTALGGQPFRVEATGDTIGLSHPLVGFGALRLATRPISHLEIGTAVGVGAGSDDIQQTASPLPISTIMTMFGVGGEVSTPWQVGPLEVRPGIAAGVRWYSVSIMSLAVAGPRGDHAPSATATTGYFGPTVSLSLRVSSAFRVGVFSQLDVFPAIGLSAGLSVEFSPPNAPRAAPIDDDGTPPALPPPSSLAPLEHIAASVEAPPASLDPLSDVPRVPNREAIPARRHVVINAQASTGLVTVEFPDDPTAHQVVHAPTEEPAEP